MKDKIYFYSNATLKTTDMMYHVIFKIKTVIGMTFWYKMKKNQKLQYVGPKIHKQQTNLDNLNNESCIGGALRMNSGLEYQKIICQVLFLISPD